MSRCTAGVVVGAMMALTLAAPASGLPVPSAANVALP